MRSSRLTAVAVATVLSVAAATAFGVVSHLSAAPGDVSSFVPVVPCRLFDTRPDTVVGSRSTPIEAGEEVTVAVWGTNGNCTIPSTATAIAANVTVVNPTGSSYLTLFPAGVARPLASNLNWTADSPPTPNHVTVSLSATGAITVFNFTGSSDVVLDIFGYYTPSAAGPAGPTFIFDSDPPASTTAGVQADFGDFTGGTLIRDLTLPPGNYELTATASVRGAADGAITPGIPTTRVRCNLVNATAVPPVSLDTGFQDFFQPDEPAPGFREVLEVGVLGTLAVETKLELRCYSFRPGGQPGAGQVPSSKIVVTQIGAITPGH